MIAAIAAAAVAGLIGSPHCIGMCGGFAILCGGKVTDTTLWHLGRITSYAALGALAGTFGSMVPGPSWLAAVISIGLMVWFSAALAGIVPEPRLVVPGLKRLGAAMAGNPSYLTRYGFGVVNGLLPCGLVYAAVAVPVALGHPLWGATAMVAFGLGTVPTLSVIALGVRRIVARDIRVRRLVAAGVLVAGLWSIGLRQGVVGEHTMDHGSGDNSEMQHNMEHMEPPDTAR
ncbi:MAG: sulfite exporter TauE/SafE family protein [Gemmatimonadota bacterium]|nr:MAG: sulfite exporter TauE/SafE family protein [Gemmatimonadota bacterium]